jgi:heme/copper-type cytochrome/quinol oxidase subunit 2
MNRTSRWIALVAGVAVLVTLFLVLRPSSDEPANGGSPSPTATATGTSTPTATETTTTSPTPDVTEIEVEFEDGQVTEGPEGGRVAVARGTTVRIVVTSDVAEEVHVHTYDFKKDVGPGRPAQFEFVADISGVFEVELEARGVLLFRLEVGA